jgi:hypothetical protein
MWVSSEILSIKLFKQEIQAVNYFIFRLYRNFGNVTETIKLLILVLLLLLLLSSSSSLLLLLMMVAIIERLCLISLHNIYMYNNRTIAKLHKNLKQKGTILI